MIRKVLIFVFVVGACIFAPPPEAHAQMQCYPGDTVIGRDGYPWCVIQQCQGGCEYCFVIQDTPY